MVYRKKFRALRVENKKANGIQHIKTGSSGERVKVLVITPGIFVFFCLSKKNKTI